MARHREDFVTLVQTEILLDKAALKKSLNMLAQAMKVPDEAIPIATVEQAAKDFVGFLRGGIKPKWLVEHEENVESARNASAKAITIAINPEADADQWWMLAEQNVEGIPRSCLGIVCDRVDAIRVTPRDAVAFIEWGESIPGWDGQPFTFKQNGVEWKPA